MERVVNPDVGIDDTEKQKFKAYLSQTQRFNRRATLASSQQFKITTNNITKIEQDDWVKSEFEPKDYKEFPTVSSITNHIF